MNENIHNYLVIALLGLLVLFQGFAMIKNKDPQTFASMDSNRIKVSQVETDSFVEVATSSTEIMATSTARVYGAIVNSGSNGIFLSLDGGPAVDSSGIYIAPNGGSYEITPENLFVGPVYGIATTSPSIITVVEALGY